MLVVIFVFINAINNATQPLINAFAMEYVNQKRKLKFGLARGIGSMGWAVSAGFVGMLIEKYSPNILGYIYLVTTIVLLLQFLSMEDLGLVVKSSSDPSDTAKRGVLVRILSNPVIRQIAVGTFFVMASHSVTTTFTINLVKRAGGADTMMGIAQFIAASSEIIGMFLFSYRVV